MRPTHASFIFISSSRPRRVDLVSALFFICCAGVVLAIALMKALCRIDKDFVIIIKRPVLARCCFP